MCINASITKVVSALIPNEQRLAVLVNGEPLEEVDRFNSDYDHEISLRSKGRVYQAVVLSEQNLYELPMREVFDNDSNHRILHVRHRDSVPSMELRCRLHLTSTPALLVQRGLSWFGHAARRPDSELIKDLLLPKPPCTWLRGTGGQLKTWATTTKADLEPLSGRYTRCIICHIAHRS